MRLSSWTTTSRLPLISKALGDDKNVFSKRFHLVLQFSIGSPPCNPTFALSFADFPGFYMVGVFLHAPYISLCSVWATRIRVVVSELKRISFRVVVQFRSWVLVDYVGWGSDRVAGRDKVRRVNRIVVRASLLQNQPKPLFSASKTQGRVRFHFSPFFRRMPILAT